MIRGEKVFADALAARRGQQQIPADLSEFAMRFEDRYGVRPLWIGAHVIPRPQSKTAVRRRLTIVLERTAEYKQFLTGPFNFDRAKQAALSRDFAETVSAATQRKLFKVRWPRTIAGDVFICFADFQTAAVELVHLAVPEAEIDNLARSAGFGDAYWQMSRTWGPPVLFLQSDADVEKYSTQPVRDALDDAYFELARRHDEFDLLDRSTTFVPLDSKENFDSNYESNWYYYWK